MALLTCSGRLKLGTTVAEQRATRTRRLLSVPAVYPHLASPDPTCSLLDRRLDAPSLALQASSKSLRAVPVPSSSAPTAMDEGKALLSQDALRPSARQHYSSGSAGRSERARHGRAAESTRKDHEDPAGRPARVNRRSRSLQVLHSTLMGEEEVLQAAAVDGCGRRQRRRASSSSTTLAEEHSAEAADANASTQAGSSRVNLQGCGTAAMESDPAVIGCASLGQHTDQPQQRGSTPVPAPAAGELGPLCWSAAPPRAVASWWKWSA